MGIFDFFREIIEKRKVALTGVPSKTKNKEIVIEKLAFLEIEDWTEKKIKENELKEKEVIIVVEEKIKDFIKELKEKIAVLEDFDVEAKKEKDEIKNLVTGSREKYIESLEELIERLNNLKEPKLEKFIEKINKIFFEFNKSSFKNYERATILIGKEMASIKESLKIFSKNLLRTFDESKLIINYLRNLSIIKKKLDTIIPINKSLEEISEKEIKLNKEISKKEKEKIILKQNLDEIKISPAYLENLAKQEKIKFIKEELKKEIFEFRQLLDFKALASFFRINPEQMRIVKDHRENFQVKFEKDNGNAIIELLEEAKLNNDEILKKIKQIQAKTKEVSNYKREINEDKTGKVYLKIKEIDLEINNLKIDMIKEQKRGEKVLINKEEQMSILKQELGKMDVELV